MKPSDLISFYEYMKERDRNKSGDPFDAINELQSSIVKWKKFTEDLEKINKKEEKKGWDAMSFPQKLIMMTAIVPFIVVMQLLLPTVILIHTLGLHQ